MKEEEWASHTRLRSHIFNDGESKTEQRELTKASK